MVDNAPEPQPTSVSRESFAEPGGVPAPVASLDPRSAAALPSPPPRAPNRLFFGRFGLRAGYGILILLALWALFGTLGGIFAVASEARLGDLARARSYAQTHPGAPRPQIHFELRPTFVDVQDGVSFLGLLGVCWLFSRGERRPFHAYGLGRYRAGDIVPGAVWGVAVMASLIDVLRAVHVLVFDRRALFGPKVAVYGAAWLFAFLLVGLAEEYAFRGYVQYTLMRGVWGLAERISATHARVVAFWTAACAFSLLFALAHTGNGGENWFGLVQVFLAGVTFAYALWRTGSLWWGVGFHMTWDWAQSFLFGVADSGSISVGRLFVTHPQGKPLLSGGADGPEGSVFATVALLLTIAIIRFTTRPGVQPALEQRPKPLPEPVVPLLHSPVD